MFDWASQGDKIHLSSWACRMISSCLFIVAVWAQKDFGAHQGDPCAALAGGSPMADKTKLGPNSPRRLDIDRCIDPWPLIELRPVPQFCGMQ